MDRVDIAYAREHLDELLERAARGEQVSIETADRGAFELRPVAPPKRKKVVLGALKGKMQDMTPEQLLAPLDEDELRLWEGEDDRT